MEQHKATRPANRRPERNPDPCPLYRKCGGCQLQNLSYPQQLVWKQNQTERLLGKFGKVEPILGMEHPYHYRNKVQAAFGQTRDKKIISGVYQSSTHRIVPVDHCMIEDEIFIYPFFHMPGTLVYNADMFRAAGLDDKVAGQYEIATWTPDEFVGILEALKAANPNVYPMALFALNNQADTWNLAYLRMFGNQFYSDDNHLVVNEDSGVKALEYILNLYNSGLTVPGAESLDSNTNNAMFQNQQIAVSFTNSVLLANLAADMESGALPAFDYRLANIPGDPHPNGFTYVTGAMVMNTGDEARIAASKEFVKYFCTDEELVTASKNGTPVRASVVSKVSGELPYLEAYNKNDQYLFNFSKNLPGYTELRNVLFPELQAALTGEKTAQQALDDYVKNGNAILDEARKSSVVYN